MLHITSNGYIDADIKVILLAIINRARKSKRSLAVVWLDIANAYGSIHHSLIQFALRRYHAPPEFCHLLDTWYTGLSASISTPVWVTPAFTLQIGVYQGDPLSVVIFLTVMAALSDTLTAWMNLGVVVPGSDIRVNHLLCADDTCITVHSSAACQQLFNVVQQWLNWAMLKAKPSKSRVLYIKASTGLIIQPLNF